MSGVTNQVMWLPQQLLFRETADLNECGVAIKDAPLGVRGRNQCLSLGKGVFVRGDRKVGAHGEGPFDGNYL